MLPFELEPGAHLEADLTVQMPADTAPGRYPVRAQLRITDDHVPAAWRQTVEDVCLITVGEAAGDVLRIEQGPADVVLTAGAVAASGRADELTARVLVEPGLISVICLARSSTKRPTALMRQATRVLSELVSALPQGTAAQSQPG